MIFIGDLEPYRKEISGKRKKQYQRLLAQADRYKTMVLPEEHPKESTTYMGLIVSQRFNGNLQRQMRFLR